MDAQGAFDGKTVGVVMQDSPGDPDIVQDGLLDTLKDLGVDVKVVNTLGCAGGNSCSTGVIESVQEMIANGVMVFGRRDARGLRDGLRVGALRCERRCFDDAADRACGR